MTLPTSRRAMLAIPIHARNSTAVSAFCFRFLGGAVLPGGRLKLRTNNCRLLTASTFPAVVRGGGDSHAAELIAVILAIEDVPLFAALENFFLLRSDALADFGVGFLFVLQRGGENLHDLLADGVAVLDEFHFVAGAPPIGNLMRTPNDL